jgi:hypothetical protein
VIRLKAGFRVEYRLNTGKCTARHLTAHPPSVSSLTSPSDLGGGALPPEGVSRFTNAPEAFRSVTYRAVRGRLREAAERLDWCSARVHHPLDRKLAHHFTSADPRRAVTFRATSAAILTSSGRFRQAGQDANNTPALCRP